MQRANRVKRGWVAAVLLIVMPGGEALEASEPLGPSSRRTGIVITEVMYAPSGAASGRNLEFVEIYNSSPIPEDLSGFRLTGDWEYRFPPNTVMAPGAVLVVAAHPQSLKDAYGLATVFGGVETDLPDGSGTLELRHRSGARLLEIPYQSRHPWPAAAGGGGASLVLAFPSQGERNPRAWKASSLIGGTPGVIERAAPENEATLVLNELCLHHPDPASRFVEVWNRSESAIDPTGYWILIDPHSPPYQIAPQPVIPPGGFRAFHGLPGTTSRTLVLLENRERTRIEDAVRVELGDVADTLSRFPDGVGPLGFSVSPTPGQRNSPHVVEDVVINEVMYHPISGDDDDEYLELLNRGTDTVSLDAWRLEGTIRFTFPSGSKLSPGGMVVVAKNRERILENYQGIDPSQVVGGFSGSLRRGFPQVRLIRPRTFSRTGPTGISQQVTIEKVVNEFEWGEGGQWGRWADGGGSSLELMDPRGSNQRAGHWADSDETGKGTWTQLERVGILELGAAVYDELQLVQLGKGECLIDDLVVSRLGEPNLVRGSDFETDTAGWVATGNHSASGVYEGALGFGGRAYRVSSSGGGDTGGNNVETDLTGRLANGQTGVIRARARWLRGTPLLLIRIRGNPLELSAQLPVPRNLGTPGRTNSQFQPNVGPAIFDVRHEPVVPAPDETVTVFASVEDVDGLQGNPLLRYRIDPAMEWHAVVMRDDAMAGDRHAGDRVFSARLPGQPRGGIVAFYIEARDGFRESKLSVFPAHAPGRECVVRFGDPVSTQSFGVYRLWLTDSVRQEWERRPPLSNQFLDGTLIYQDSRIVYGVGARYHGSPYSRPGYNGPTRNLCAFNLETPKDDPILGVDELYLDPPELYSKDPTLLREELSFYLADRFDIPFSHKRYVNFWVNGTRRGIVCAETQQPNTDFIKAWFPEDDRGDLFKIDDWFEFSDSGIIESWVNATLEPFTAFGGTKAQARYRWNWEKKANGGWDDDYREIFRLVDALNERNADLYTARVESLVDVEEWMRAFAIRHITEDSDGYGYGRGKNMFAYKPTDGRWQMIVTDLDHGLGSYNPSTSDSLYAVNDPTIGRMYQHPPFRRAYLRALKEAIQGPYSSAAFESRVRDLETALTGNAVPVGSLAPLRTWMEARRNFIRTAVALEDTSQFRLLAPPAAGYETNRNLVILRGTAPVHIKTVLANGRPYPTRWTTPIAWEMTVPLHPGTNDLRIAGLDRWGLLVGSNELAVGVRFTGTSDRAERTVVINEIQPRAPLPGAEFLELFNASPSTAFDLSDWRLEGVDFVFPAGSLLHPNSFVVIASSPGSFREAYPDFVPPVGYFLGRLDPEGETLRLVQAPAQKSPAAVVDEVSYRTTAPWPSNPQGSRASLQLMDVASDNDHPRNWFAAPPEPSNAPYTYVGFTNVWRYDQSGRDLRKDWRLEDYDDSTWSSGAGLFFVENAVLPASKRTALRLGPTTYYFRTRITNDVPYGPGGTLRLYTLVDDGAVFYLNNVELFRSGMPTGEVSSMTFATRNVNDATIEGPFDVPAASLRPGENVLAVEVHQLNAFSADVVFGATLQSGLIHGAPYTPGRANTLRQPLPTATRIVINEWMAANTDFLRDPASGLFSDWFELYNPSGTMISLEGWTLTDDWKEPAKFRIPPGRQIGPDGYLLVWADDRPSLNQAQRDLHVNFKLGQSGEIIALFMPDGTLSDSVTFGQQTENESEGRFPQASPSPYSRFKSPSPLRSNGTEVPPEPPLRIVTVTLVDRDLSLECEVVVGRTYALQVRSGLVEGAWQEQGRAERATRDRLRFVFPVSSEGVGFYRILAIDP